MKFHLKVEGVNFASCLYDTNDISVIRGSSLLLDSIKGPVSEALRATQCKNVNPEWAGASKAKFTFDADEDIAQDALAAVRARLSQGPYKHLSFVASIGNSDEVAEARNRASQFRQWTVPDCAVPDAVLPDALDGMRPAAPDCRDNLKGALSPSVQARLAYGRKNRKGFFENRVADVLPQDISFCDSFHDMVHGAPNWVSETVRNKLAIIHFDGDGFGKAREASDSAAAFSDELNDQMQQVLTALVKGATGDGVLRLEVLVWGGDDITLVVPAWRALTCAQDFYASTVGMSLAGQPVGFTGGVIVANYKAPIRQLTALAGEAVDLGKAANARGGFTFDAFESAAPPENGLADHRKRVFGEVSARGLSFPGQEVEGLIQMLTEWKSGQSRGLPSRSRLFDLLASDVPDGETRDAWIEKELGRDAVRLAVADEDNSEAVTMPGLDDAPRRKSLEFMLSATLWDYVPTAEREADA